MENAERGRQREEGFGGARGKGEWIAGEGHVGVEVAGDGGFPGVVIKGIHITKN